MPAHTLSKSLLEGLALIAARGREVQAREAQLRADPDRLVGIDEAAEITQLTVPSLAVYRCTGRLRAVSKPYQRVQYRVGDLLAYVAKYGRRA